MPLSLDKALARVKPIVLESSPTSININASIKGNDAKIHIWHLINACFGQAKILSRKTKKARFVPLPDIM